MIAPSVGAFGLFLLIISVCCLQRKKRSKGTNTPNLSSRSMASPSVSLHSGRRSAAGGTNSSVEMSSLLPRKHTRAQEFSLSAIRFIEELGEGAFGKVYRGELIMSANNAIVPVAIKTLKEDATLKTKQDFQREAELMTDLQHPNIVCLLGVCFREEPPMCMLFEFMSEGDLHEFLLSHSPRTDVPVSSNGLLPGGKRVLDINDFLHIATQIGKDRSMINGLFEWTWLLEMLLDICDQ